MYAQRELPKAHGSLAIALAKSPNSQSHSPRASQSHPRDPTSKWFGSSDWTVTMAKTWVRCGGLGRPVRYNMVQLRGEQQTTRWKWGLDIRLGVFAGIYIYVYTYMIIVDSILICVFMNLWSTQILIPPISQVSTLQCLKKCHLKAGKDLWWIYGKVYAMILPLKYGNPRNCGAKKQVGLSLSNKMGMR